VNLFAGIDGGQSNTIAVIAGENGNILGRGTAGPSDEVAQSPESTRLHDALRDALRAALADAHLPEDTRFTAIVAGISGYEGRVHGRTPELPTDRLMLVHDSENAHAGALGGEPGVVVIAGTGSVGFARNGAASALVGGWGYLFGDEGSAFWLVRTALADAMRDADTGQGNELASLALEYFQQPSLRQLSRSFYLGKISRAQFASFAPVILESAQRGNAQAGRYLLEGAAALAALAMRAMQQAGLRDAKVAFIGGMMRSTAYRNQIGRELRRLAPHAELVEPRYDAATGALVLAYERSGTPLPGRIA
jgi:glucosamine kinase